MAEVGFVERTLSAYPGRISAVISLPHAENCRRKHISGYSTKEFESVKKDLLDNPMVTAIFIDGMDSCNQWKKYAEIVSWAKSNKLSIGIGDHGSEHSEISSAISSNNVDFVRICTHLKDMKEKEHVEKLKKNLAKVRASGIKYEFCLEIDSNVESIAAIKDAYNLFSPCSNFVVQSSHKLNTDRKEELVNFAREAQNIILRLW